MFTVGSLAGQFLIGFSLALLFSLRFPGRTFARSLVIVPWLLPLIVTGVIFRFMFQAEGGAINQVLIDVGIIHHPTQWLNDPNLAMWTILVANIWLGVPFFTLLLYSALQDVPAEVREAAIIDGASPWQRLRLVIVPIILPVIEVTLLLGFVFTVKVFDLVIGLTGGGPANATQLITTWSYNLSFQVFSFGEGAALNNVLLVLALVAAPLYLWLSRDSLRRSSGGREMSRLERSRGLRLLCTFAAVAALVVILFPVYAIIVGSFESTETLFSGTFYWLPHAATLDNYRTVLGGASAATQETVSGSQTGNILTSLLLGLGTALLALVVAVPAAYALAKYRMRVTVVVVSALLVAQIVPSIVLATSLFIVFHWVHLVNSYFGLILADGTYAVPFAILVLRAFFFSLPNELIDAARVDGALGVEDVPPRRGPALALGCHHRCRLRVPGRLGGLHLRIDDAERRRHPAGHARDLQLSRQLFDRLGRGNGVCSNCPGAGRDPADRCAAVHREWSHGGLGEGLARGVIAEKPCS